MGDNTKERSAVQGTGLLAPASPARRPNAFADTSFPDEGSARMSKDRSEQSHTVRRPGSCILTGCLVAFLGAGVLAFLAMIGVAVWIVTGPPASFEGRFGAGKKYQFREVTLSGRSRQPKVVRIPVEGLIMGSGFGRSGDPVSVFKARLDRAQEDHKVSAVLLTINSPGGGVTASDTMHQYLKRFKQEEDMPVVGYMQDMAASGGYYVASGCDRIMAQPTTVTGSIGVMMPLYDASELMKHIGVEDTTVKSGKYKDMGSLLADKTEEQRQQERELFQQLVDHLHDRFVGIVAEGRDLDQARVREIADGRVLTSQQALERKLIDKIGYYEDAVQMTEEMANIAEAHVVEYQRVVSLSEVFGMWGKGPEVKIELGDRLPEALRSKPLYLWTPPADKE